MEAKFKKGQSVRITKRNGEVIDGVIRDWDYNICTFGREYNVDYMKDGPGLDCDMCSGGCHTRTPIDFRGS